MQAALTSAASFAFGAAMPLLAVMISLSDVLIKIVTFASLGFLALLGAVGAKTGGADVARATAQDGHILGCTCHGVDCWHRRRFWCQTIILPIDG